MKVHLGSVESAAQLLPGALENTVAVMVWLPGSGSFTLSVRVVVTIPPTGMLPVQVSASDVRSRTPSSRPGRRWGSCRRWCQRAG